MVNEDEFSASLLLLPPPDTVAFWPGRLSRVSPVARRAPILSGSETSLSICAPAVTHTHEAETIAWPITRGASRVTRFAARAPGSTCNRASRDATAPAASPLDALVLKRARVVYSAPLLILGANMAARASTGPSNDHKWQERSEPHLKIESGEAMLHHHCPRCSRDIVTVLPLRKSSRCLRLGAPLLSSR
jgi:hypothetical protein